MPEDVRNSGRSAVQRRLLPRLHAFEQRLHHFLNDQPVTQRDLALGVIEHTPEQRMNLQRNLK